MPDPFERMALLYGGAAMERLKGARVAVFGIGGVGGYVVEALARSGIGALDLIDHDRVSFSNLNRQIIATRSSLGRCKVEVASERIRDINPDCAVRTYQTFFLPETAGDFDFGVYDYVVDAVDTVTAKLLIAEKARDAGVPVISAMGTGTPACPSSRPWGPGTSCTPTAWRSRTSLKPRNARWPASCARKRENGGSNT